MKAEAILREKQHLSCLCIVHSCGRAYEAIRYKTSFIQWY